MPRVRLCFVCLGNICRSPIAEAIMRALVREVDLEDAIHVDSAGTGTYHLGEPPDERARAAGARRGVEVTGAARRFAARDFDRFDYVLAMDRENRDDLLALAATPDAAQRVVLLRAFDPSSPPEAEVPDPYLGGRQGFADVVEICDRACRGLLAHLRRAHELP